MSQDGEASSLTCDVNENEKVNQRGREEKQDEDKRDPLSPGQLCCLPTMLLSDLAELRIKFELGATKFQ